MGSAASSRINRIFVNGTRVTRQRPQLAMFGLDRSERFRLPLRVCNISESLDEYAECAEYNVAAAWGYD